jgi:hypothetical protein
MAGESVDLDALDQPALTHEARFISDSQNRLVGDRAFNANAIGRALLGEQLLRVEDDPKSSNRQMAQLTGDRRLETTVTGRQQLSPNADTFLADELVLQILHAPGPPRLSQVETLSRYQRCGLRDLCRAVARDIPPTRRKFARHHQGQPPLPAAVHTSSSVRSINLSSS